MTLYQRIIDLENKINQQQRENKPHICIFKDCPKDSQSKNNLLYGQINLGDHNVCTFNKCPDSANSIKTKGDSNICLFNKCPSGSVSLMDYLMDTSILKKKATQQKTQKIVQDIDQLNINPNKKKIKHNQKHKKIINKLHSLNL